ncbi:MAG: right-handed parallel beta-helix repeat-containing protein [Anaerolineae bacterium]|nr:right-handed parallel beta-helix repeat-containing protein [Anaerolineae bacterium]
MPPSTGHLPLPEIGQHTSGIDKDLPAILRDDFATDPNTNGQWTIHRAAGDPASEAYWHPTQQVLYLTTATNGRASAVFADVDLLAHRWEAQFRFRAGGGSGADGFTFMFYKDKSAYGSPGGGGTLGFKVYHDGQSWPVSGYGIEFDNYYGTTENDPSARHIGLIKDTTANHLAAVNDNRVEDNVWHDARVTFDEGQIEVWIDGGRVINYTIPNPDYTYTGIGFSAATGGLNNNHVIDDFVLYAPQTGGIYLLSGWNLVAWPRLSSDMHLASVLAPAAGMYDTALAFAPSTPDDPWRGYRPGTATYLNDLAVIDPTMGLWVHATDNVLLPFTGTPPLTAEIPLHQGWNLVGFPIRHTRAISDVLAPIDGFYSTVYGYQAGIPTGSWSSYEVGESDSDLLSLDPGRGYWLLATQSCTLPITNTYPDLVVHSVGVVSTTVTATETFTLELILANQGAGDADEPFRADWYLDPSILPTATLEGAGSWTVPSLAAGMTTTLTDTHTVGWPGYYPLYAYADTTITTSGVDEEDETNNLGGPVTVTVTGPTPVCGSVVTHTTWPLLGSPYIVTCDVTVEASAILTIEAGSQVEFQSGTGLFVEGALIADGVQSRDVVAGHRPYGMAVDSDAGRVYVAASGDDALSVMSAVTHTRLFTLPVGHHPVDVSVDAPRDRIYVTLAGSGHLLALNRDTLTPLADYRVGGAPTGIDIDPATGRIFVALGADEAVAVVDATTLTTTHLLPVGCSPRWVAFNSANGQAYITNYCDGTVSVIDTSPVVTVTGVITVGNGPWKIETDATNNRIFVANDADSTISVIDGDTDAVIATVPVAGGASGVSYDAANDRLYVANWRTNSVTRLDGTTFAVQDVFPVGAYPVDVGLFSPTMDVFAANSRTGDVSVIDAGDSTPATMPITFTSHANLPTAGSWKGIIFQSGSTGRLRHTVVEYGGRATEGYGNLFVQSDDVHVLNTVVRYSGSSGIRVKNASPVIVGDEIRENVSYGLRAEGLSSPDIAASTILSNTNYAAYIDRTAFPEFVGNQVDGNGTDGIRVDAGSITISGGWYSDEDLPYVLLGSITVNPGITLTISSSSLAPASAMVIKISGNQTVFVVDGSLQILGGSCQPIVLTSIKDDVYAGDTNRDGNTTTPANGDWSGIWLRTGSMTNIQQTDIRYGGYYWYEPPTIRGLRGSIYANGGTLTMAHSAISHSGGGRAFTSYTGAIYADNAASVRVADSDIEYNAQPSIRAYSSSLSLANSRIHANALGLYFTHKDMNQLSITNSQFISNTDLVAQLRFEPMAAGRPDLSGNTATGNNSNSVDLAGTVTGTASLPSDLPYSSADLAVAEGARLALDPGVTIRFSRYEATLAVAGTLVAHGTSSLPITLTSHKDITGLVPANGDWEVIRISSAGTADLEHVNIRYGGYYWYEPPTIRGLRGSIYANGGTLTMTHSTISHSGGGRAFPSYTGAIYADNAALVHITDSDIEYNAQPSIRAYSSSLALASSRIQGNSWGLYYTHDDMGQLSISNSQFISNTDVAAQLRFVPMAAGRPSLNGNMATGNDTDAIDLVGTVTGTASLPTDLPYSSGGFAIANGARLVLDPGITIHFAGYQTTLEIAGTLFAHGTSSLPITLTSLNDSAGRVPANGDWAGVHIASTGIGDLEHVNIRYGGYYWYDPPSIHGLRGSIYANGMLTMTHSTINHSGGGRAFTFYTGAVFADSDSVVRVSNSTITLNAQAGIRVVDGADVAASENIIATNSYGLWLEDSALSIFNNCIYSNSIYGAYNAIAPGEIVHLGANYWGSLDGPCPVGEGDRINFQQICHTCIPDPCPVTPCPPLLCPPEVACGTCGERWCLEDHCCVRQIYIDAPWLSYCPVTASNTLPKQPSRVDWADEYGVAYSQE